MGRHLVGPTVCNSLFSVGAFRVNVLIMHPSGIVYCRQRDDDERNNDCTDSDLIDCSNAAPTMAPAYAEGANGTHVPTCCPLLRNQKVIRLYS